MSQDASERCAIYQEEAFILAELGRTDEALEQLNKTDAFDCDHVEMLVIKGHIMLAAQRQKEAQNYFAEALANSQDRMRTMLHIIVSVYNLYGGDISVFFGMIIYHAFSATTLDSVLVNIS